MPTQYTPIYQLPYPQIGDPIKEGAANIEGIAKTLETTLQNGSFPASTPDVASITARLNALEASSAKAPLGIIGKTVTTAAGGFVTAQAAIDAVNNLQLKAGRQYRLVYTFSTTSPSANSAVAMNFIKTATTETGFVGSGVRGVTLWTAPAASSGKTVEMSALYSPATNETVRIVTTAQQVVGTGGVQISDRHLTVIDLGKQI